MSYGEVGEIDDVSEGHAAKLYGTGFVSRSWAGVAARDRSMIKFDSDKLLAKVRRLTE